jgi:hypothetical protein
MRAIYSLALVLAACERPSPLVICHNANCATNNAELDDTRDALEDSFALVYDGRPALDGMEIDTFWHGAQGRCLFAHDLETPTAIPAFDAAQLIADYLAATPVVSRNSERFYMFIELKGFVGTSFDDRHTPDQFAAHASCALDVANLIALGATMGGHPITIGFIAGVPMHHVTLRDNPRWQTLDDDPNVELKLIGDIFAPYSDLVPELADFKIPLDIVEYHPDYMTAEREETYRSLGLELAQWSYVSTREAFDAIERWEPTFAITNEALLLRRWIEN